MYITSGAGSQSDSELIFVFVVMTRLGWEFCAILVNFCVGALEVGPPESLEVGRPCAQGKEGETDPCSWMLPDANLVLVCWPGPGRMSMFMYLIWFW